MIKLENICFTRDNKKILDNVNLTLDDNKFYVITGPNGSGKSTLAKILMGIIKPDSGRILVDNIDITNKSVTERSKLGIGFAFQTPVCFKGITVYDLLKIAMYKELTKNEACKILSEVGLCAKEYVDREVNHSLSGGELKRIEIATILAKEPKISIFDEPEAGIDLWSFNNLINIFNKLQEKNNSTTIIISHQERLINIADQIILMEKGKANIMNNKNIKNIMHSKMCCKKEMMYE
ncbi:MAG: energy-coupling factor ABC transporter ATP-binding protein [Tenericutes bacterium]|nr:energy-coupling factor ABC transporter ATP-binding protein [Mycoplasmatota bacterium]MDY3800437.1 ABC transporter ATP-binding protein [Bacilli bacterium]